MLVIEIAAGVLLGLLAYRGIDSYCIKRNLTVIRAVILLAYRLLSWTAMLAILGGIGFVCYYALTHLRSLANYEHEIFVGITAICILGFLAALRSDIRKGRKYKVVVAKTACDKCGEMSLKFTGFKDVYKSGVGAYDHPKAKCSGCGHEQMLLTLN